MGNERKKKVGNQEDGKPREINLRLDITSWEAKRTKKWETKRKHRIRKPRGKNMWEAQRKDNLVNQENKMGNQDWKTKTEKISGEARRQRMGNQQGKYVGNKK